MTPSTSLPEETFIWVVTKSDVRWVRSELGTAALAREVAALRCGLDTSNWVDASGWHERTTSSSYARRTRSRVATAARS